MVRFCPECGTARLEGAAACGNCGYMFAPPAAAQAPAAAAPVAPPPVTAVAPEPPVAEHAPAEPSRSRPKWLAIGAGALVLAAAGAGGWYVTYHTNLLDGVL